MRSRHSGTPACQRYDSSWESLRWIDQTLLSKWDERCGSLACVSPQSSTMTWPIDSANSAWFSAQIRRYRLHLWQTALRTANSFWGRCHGSASYCDCRIQRNRKRHSSLIGYSEHNCPQALALGTSHVSRSVLAGPDVGTGWPTTTSGLRK